jgi:Predicted AAA-ATPase/PD-(D/E)XK nuclease superfamily
MTEIKLPIGVQDFDKLRKGGFVYVDKTEHLLKVLNGAGQYFLSRPRRFGKSLFISTLKHLFLGQKDLFKGLYIEDKWDWNQKYPIIHISFASIGYRESGLQAAIEAELNLLANQNGFTFKEVGFSRRFRELIVHLSAQSPVVILIDEYDKPIIDYLDKDEIKLAKINRDILKTFYSVIKDLDANIRLLFITGVSKFSKVSIFSDLNHLIDLTTDKMAVDMCGYTQTELEENFATILATMPPGTLENMKTWYNGYSWDAKTHIYNPFSVLGFFQKGEFDNFWFESGTPTFLVKLINKNIEYDFESIEADPNIFNSYSLEKLEYIPLLFQTGYLTIKGRSKYGMYQLGYPNKEVRDAMMKYLLGGFLKIDVGSTSPTVLTILESLDNNDLVTTKNALQALFKSIPAHIFIRKSEKYYHSIIHLTFQIIGMYAQSEVHTSDGRMDTVVFTDERIFIFEFKIDQSAEIALQQIHTKDYASLYRASGKPITGIGVNFGSKTKGITEWLTENL